MKIFESDLAEAIFEVIANTSLRDDGELFLEQIRADASEYNFDLHMSHAKITIYNGDESFDIVIHKTHKFK